MRYAAAVLAAALALTACTDGAGKGTPEDPLPMVGIAACPAPETLLARAEEPAKGERLPDETLPCFGRNAEEGSVRLRAVGKRPSVVNLWASWCGPCRTEMPEFEKVHVELGERVLFLGVDTKDFPKPARVAIQNAAVTYASAFDPDELVKRALGVRSLPATVLVGADGLVKNVHVGELTADELRALLKKHLGVS